MRDLSAIILCLLLMTGVAHADTTQGKIAICRRPHISGHENQNLTIKHGSRFAQDLGYTIGIVVATDADADIPKGSSCTSAMAHIVQYNPGHAIVAREKLLQQYSSGQGEAPPELDAFVASGFQ